jgi:lactate permease
LDAPAATATTGSRDSRRAVAVAWAPWLLLSACVFVWGLPPVRTFLNGGLTKEAIAAREPQPVAPPPPPALPAVAPRPKVVPVAATTAAPGQPLAWWEEPNILAGWTAPRWEVPQLHGRVYRHPSIVRGDNKPEEAVLVFNWLSATGTAIFVAALLTAALLGVPPRDVAATFVQTLHQMRWPLATIAAMLAIAYTTRYSGTDVTLGLAFTYTGVAYPFFAAMLGWLGVALTGSDTSSNALFGSLQRFTAEQLELNPVLICAANSTGGVMGKMIDAQSIVVSAAATCQPGGEGPILRYVFWHSVALASLVGALTLAQAYLWPWMAPAP